MNFETPYAIDRPVNAPPSCAFELRVFDENVRHRQGKILPDKIERRIPDEDPGEDLPPEPLVVAIDLLSGDAL